MTISEKARQIAENYAECEWDACNEAALEMAEWLIKNLYEQLESKKQLMHVYGGTFPCVSMGDVQLVLQIKQTQTHTKHSELCYDRHGNPIINNML